ncbi:unannotated protein [freshwater metagenome]|uniref:Unannotated protein n=1 Tax=freshwater metagenome TaxID=449393 RepID=A0A6J7FM40_9ZZZZ
MGLSANSAPDSPTTIRIDPPSHFDDMSVDRAITSSVVTSLSMHSELATRTGSRKLNWER